MPPLPRNPGCAEAKASQKEREQKDVTNLAMKWNQELVCSMNESGLDLSSRFTEGHYSPPDSTTYAITEAGESEQTTASDSGPR